MEKAQSFACSTRLGVGYSGWPPSLSENLNAKLGGVSTPTEPNFDLVDSICMDHNYGPRLCGDAGLTGTMAKLDDQP